MDQKENVKITGYNNFKGLNYISSRIKKYNLLMKTFIDGKISPLKWVIITFDFVGSVIFLGAGINDYFQYNFYYRRYNIRRKFIVGRKWLSMVKKFNGSLKIEQFDDKSQFNKSYSKFLGREWLDTENSSVENFKEFLTKHPRALYKIKGGSGGNGIGIYEYKESENYDIEAEYIRMKNNRLILEEVIVQHSEMAKFNPSSVNTLRIVTVIKDNKANIMHAIFRTGNGNGYTDNFHHLGLAALVDIESGIVYTTAIDKLNKKYVKHPKSGYQITGFKIPLWDKIVQIIVEAALVNPAVRYVGWDVAIKADGTICIIEGNCASDPDITQMPDQIGKWNEYRHLF